MTTARVNHPLSRPLLLDSFTWAAAGTAALVLAAVPVALPDAWRAVSPLIRSAMHNPLDSSEVMAAYVGLALLPVAALSIAAIVAERAGTAWLARRWSATSGQIVVRHQEGSLYTFLAMLLLTPLFGRGLLVPVTRNWPVLIDRYGALTRDGARVEWRDLSEVVRVQSVQHAGSYVMFFRSGARLDVNLNAIENLDEVSGALSSLGVLR